MPKQTVVFMKGRWYLVEKLLNTEGKDGVFLSPQCIFGEEVKPEVGDIVAHHNCDSGWMRSLDSMKLDLDDMYRIFDPLHRNDADIAFISAMQNESGGQFLASTVNLDYTSGTHIVTGGWIECRKAEGWKLL